MNPKLLSEQFEISSGEIRRVLLTIAYTAYTVLWMYAAQDK